MIQQLYLLSLVHMLSHFRFNKVLTAYVVNISVLNMNIYTICSMYN